MDTPLEKTIRRNSIVVSILIVIAVFAMLAFISTYASLKTTFAVLAFTVSIILPIHQKRFSFSSLFLGVIGILFMLSGLIENVADNFLNSSPIHSQIELLRIVGTRQLSFGFWYVAIGMCNTVLAWGWWASLRNRSQASRRRRWLPLFLGVSGLPYIILGASSIINGLSRL